MSFYNGKVLKIEIYGESHAESIGAKVKGFPRTEIDFDKLSEFMQRRQAKKTVYSTARIELDAPIFSNCKNNVAEGEFSVEIKNANVKSKDYNSLYAIPRPSHADYCWYLKDGTLDFTGGGRFSGRLTAPFCVVGGLCKQYLENLGVKVLSYVSQIGDIKGRSYKTDNVTQEDIQAIQNQLMPSLSRGEEMLKEIEKAKADGDSVGGKAECIVYGLKGGLGDNLFEGIEGKISSLLFSIPAVKGVEFGIGFDFCKSFGSKVNDGLRYNGEKVELITNNNGGINGGISNGAPITLSVAFKPTPSISKEQKSVNLAQKTDCNLKIEGRHDSCIVPRAVPCVESAVAIALTDIILGERYGQNQ